jgi:hypothetical protein
VDPLIQSPTSTQSVNPYSYIMNNPLAGTDPTGYCSTKDSVEGCADSLGEGESSDIKEGGKVVGTVGKDSQGNMYITKSNGNAGHQAIQGAMAKVSDLGGLKQISKQDGGNPLSNNIKEYASKNPYKTKSKDSYSTIPVDESNLDKNVSDYNMVTLHHTGDATTPTDVEDMHRANEGIVTLMRQAGDVVGLTQAYNNADVGYHFMISEDGTIYEGRSLEYAGAHVKGHNQGNVGIAFLGNYSTRALSKNQVGAAEPVS